MKFYRIALSVAVLVAVTSIASAGYVSRNLDPVELRAAAIVTTSDVVTTFSAATLGTPDNKIEAVVVYVSYTIGSATNVVITPAGAMTGNPAAAGYYKNSSKAVTLTASGTYAIRVPREEFAAGQYMGIVALGSGTQTSSSLTITVLPEIRR